MAAMDFMAIAILGVAGFIASAEAKGEKYVSRIYLVNMRVWFVLQLY